MGASRKAGAKARGKARGKAEVTLGVRADRAVVVRLLETRGERAFVGPVRPGGWVPVALLPAADLDRLGADLSRAISPLTVAAVVRPRTLDVIAWRDGEEAARYRWPDKDAGFAQLATAAGVKADEPEGSEPAHQLSLLCEALGLPLTDEDDAPTSALVLSRGTRTEIEFAADAVGDVWTVVAAPEWSTLVPDPPKDHPLHVSRHSEVVAETLSGLTRRRPVIELFAGPDERCGYRLWRDGAVADGHDWNLPWEPVALPDDAADGDPAALARTTGGPEAGFAEVIRRRGQPAHQVLTELAVLAGFPLHVTGLLTGATTAGRLPGARRHERNARRAIFSYARAPVLEHDPPKRRRLAIIGAVVALIVAAVALLLMAGGIMAMAGSSTPGITEDHVLVVFATAVFTANVAFAVKRIRLAVRLTRELAERRDSGTEQGKEWA